jgi:GNAT superfamily N-acetyltransferase
VDEFRSFLARGDRGFYAYRDGRVVHRTWVRMGPATERLWHAWGAIEVPAGEAYLHYCETAPSARGLGLYPATLAHAAGVARLLGAREVSISTDLENAASRRGIERAGFTEYRRVRVDIRFGVGTQHDVLTGEPGPST